MSQEKFKILVADDEDGIRFVLKDVLTGEGYNVEEAKDGKEALEKLNSDNFHLAVLDIKMPFIDGINVLKEVRKSKPELVLIMITAHGTQNTALEAIREGAYDYFSKPFDLDELRVVIKRALEKVNLMQQIRNLRAELSNRNRLGQLIGASKPMQDVFDLIKKVTESDVTVIIYGESGTGKELVAHAIHHNSLRKSKPFVKLNCVAIPETLLESEMFGHEKGAFTGAYQQQIGKFEQANGGSIFLDEIGDMPSSLQAKMLRVLQEKEFERIGGSKTVRVDVRMIAATNKDLTAEVEHKRFREDLYFRINVLPIYIPPLRERVSDIPLFVEHFINYYNPRLNKDISGVSTKVREVFMNYAWPGNVRELENVLQRAMIVAEGSIITPENLPKNVTATEGNNLLSDYLEQSDDVTLPLTEVVQDISEEVEKRYIQRALDKVDHHRQKAANLLKISRKSLHNKMVKYGLFE